MLATTVIAAKRDNQELTDAQLHFLISGYCNDSIPDYQMAAFAMAVYLNGMTPRETAALTREMLDSGTRLQWPNDGIPRVDKHSTGGLGDKTSIVLAPLLAAAGVQVPMLSGRGLGATGGTLDKLESIPGYRTDLNLQEITRITQQTGCVITGASAELAPADRRLYALRDVTATVPSIPLITASILSKKLAESPDALILDVKFGSGAFMKSEETAKQLAESLVHTGSHLGVPVQALLTDMNQPLGRCSGNAVEILECLEVLRGTGPSDVRELTLQLAARLLTAVDHADSLDVALTQLGRLLDDGTALTYYERMVAAQSGDPSARLSVAPAHDVVADTDGFLTTVNAEQIGLTIVEMGGGRRVMSDRIDHSVGIEMLARIGDPVHVGQPLARVFTKLPEVFVSRVRNCLTIGEVAAPRPLITGEIHLD
ncbi:MAG: thymidine phosphorylase [Planctomycetaceae bacterium]|nr:thymidine phosphorylase [Planctomycetaceae bacterium]